MRNSFWTGAKSVRSLVKGAGLSIGVDKVGPRFRREKRTHSLALHLEEDLEENAAFVVLAPLHSL